MYSLAFLYLLAYLSLSSFLLFRFQLDTKTTKNERDNRQNEIVLACLAHSWGIFKITILFFFSLLFFCVCCGRKAVKKKKKPKSNGE